MIQHISDRAESERAAGSSLLKGTVCTFFWFSSSILIVFVNKHLLSTMDFHFPFFLTFFTNSGVFIITYLLTRVPAFRQPPVPTPTYLYVIIPLGAATMLDIGFSNWSLIYLEIAFQVIIKGAAPLFVLTCGLCLGIERPTPYTPLALTLIMAGLVLVSGDSLTLPDRPLGLGLALMSVTFVGLRWSLTQLLITGPGAVGGHAGHTEGDGDGSGSPASGPRGGGDASKTSPLASMLNTLPVIAGGALLCVFAIERRAFGVLVELHDDGKLGTLTLYMLFQCTQVFVLVLAEFEMIQLTSALTVSIFGVFKELVTVVTAVVAGDHLSAANALGVALCLSGNILYFLTRSGDAAPVTRRPRSAHEVGLAEEKTPVFSMDEGSAGELGGELELQSHQAGGASPSIEAPVDGAAGAAEGGRA
jgi:solute carrier family 35 protein C2